MAQDAETGPLTEFLASDHRRLDALLQSALAQPEQVDRESYDRFRAGLLRHIGLEEKILFPALQRWRGGEPLPLAATLRREHGALATLLVPTPTVAILATLRRLLADHNRLEEGPGGIYELCDRLAGAEAPLLLTAMRAVPPVSVMPHSDSPAVMTTLRHVLERAGYGLENAPGQAEPVTPAQES